MSRPYRDRAPPKPLERAALEQLALSYVGRYATTRAKLGRYLERKLRERGWDGEGGAPVNAIVERCATLGYVDDGAFAASRGAALGRRGFGERRIADALRDAGIAPEDAAPVREAAREDPLAAALIFARRRRIGPFAAEDGDADRRRKALGALLRAGHPMDVSRRVAFAAVGAELDRE